MDEVLKDIVSGAIIGKDATTVLRKALEEIYKAEEILRQRRELVAKAETALIYGLEGRPQRFGSSFIEGAA